jgi:hypothetical protein
VKPPRYFRNKKREYLKDKINEQQQPRKNLVKDEMEIEFW